MVPAALCVSLRATTSKTKPQPVSIRSSGICALNLCRVRERLKVAAAVAVAEVALVAAVLMGHSFYPARIK